MWKIVRGSVVAKMPQSQGKIPMDKMGKLYPSSNLNIKMASRLLNECLLDKAYNKFSLPLHYVSQISTYFPLIACYREGLYDSLLQLAPDDKTNRTKPLTKLITNIKDVANMLNEQTNFSLGNTTSINNNCKEAYRQMSENVEQIISGSNNRSLLDFMFRLTRPSYTLEEMLLRKDLLDVESYYEHVQYSVFTYFYKAVLNKEGGSNNSSNDIMQVDTFSIDHPEVASLGLLTNIYVMERLLKMPEFTGDELTATIARANLLQKPHFGDFNVHQLRKVSFIMPEDVESLGFTVKGGQVFTNQSKFFATIFHFSPVYVSEVEPGSFVDQHRLFAKGDKILAVNNALCLDQGMPVTKRFIRNSLNLSLKNQRYVTFTVMHDPGQFIRDFYKDNLFYRFFSELGNNQLKFSPHFRQPKIQRGSRGARFYLRIDR